MFNEIIQFLGFIVGSLLALIVVLIVESFIDDYLYNRED
jgi:hypothetical protein